MSGNPAFQATVFQNSAFQAGVIVVAAGYSLGALSFARPTLTTVSKAYSLGTPTFGTPTLATAAAIEQLHASTYSLATPTFSVPTFAYQLNLSAKAYALASPSFAKPGFTALHHLFSNAMSLSPLSWQTALLERNYQLHAPASYWLGSPTFQQDLAILVNRVLAVAAGGYSLGKLGFGYPRLRVQIVEQPWPRSYYSQAHEAALMLGNFLNLILMSLPPGQTPERDVCRRLTTTLRDNADAAIRGNTLGTDLQAVINAADAAGCSFHGIEAARQYLMSQTASTSIFTQVVFRSALTMILAEECLLVSRTPYATQAEILTMIYHMRDIFDAAKAIGIDEVDVNLYRGLNEMGGKIINHLATVELQLPRFMAYRLPMPMPSLYVAQRVYGDARRSDELERENGVIHPAFMPVNIRVLSNAPVGRS